ncbi:MAG: DUF6676 family protein [Actinomycetota bacterium]
MKKIAIALTSVVFLVAATPADVAPDLSAQGYYIETGADASESSVSAAVADARADGGRLFIVILASEPNGGSTVFAENALDEVGGTGTVFTVAPATVGWASDGDIYTREQLDAAADASLDGGSDTEVVTIFVGELTGSPVGGSSGSESGGGLPWGWIILLLIVGGIGFLIWRSKRKATHARSEALDEIRGEVQKRLDDVANDIIDLEAEVGLSDDSTARQHYEDATIAYGRVSEEFARTTDAGGLMDLAYELDLAIWHLDSAEALLDGETPPPKPEKPAPVPPPTPQRTEPAAPSGSIEGFPVPPRRPQRRSTPNTSSMMQTMLAAAAMSAMRSNRGSRGARRASTSARPARRRMRGGGRRRG